MAENSTPTKRPQLAAVLLRFQSTCTPQHIDDHLLDGYGWDGKWHRRQMDLVSLYVDQRKPGDVAQERADRHLQLKIYPTIAGATQDFNISGRITGGDTVSTQFFMQLQPNLRNSACPAAKIEQMYGTRTAPCSVKRTLLTSGVLEAPLNSRLRLNQRLETPHLTVGYQPATESQYSLG